MDTGEWETWEDYLDRMRRPGEWGDPLTILSAANTYGIDIDIYQSTGTSESSIYNYEHLTQLRRLIPCCHQLFGKITYLTSLYQC